MKLSSEVSAYFLEYAKKLEVTSLPRIQRSLLSAFCVCLRNRFEPFSVLLPE